MSAPSLAAAPRPAPVDPPPVPPAAARGAGSPGQPVATASDPASDPAPAPPVLTLVGTPALGSPPPAAVAQPAPPQAAPPQAAAPASPPRVRNRRVVRRLPAQTAGTGGAPLRPLSGPGAAVDCEAVAAALPDWAQEACRAAVDPLEVVTTLEVSGVTAGIAAERFGADDVMVLGRRLFRQLALRPAPVTDQRLPRRGNGWDLLRGATFVIPGLLLSTVAAGLRLHLAWWTLPLAVVVGWAASQVLTALAGIAEGRDRHPGRAMACTIAVSVVVAGGSAWAAWSLIGGNPASALTVVSLAAYLVACAVLIALRRMWLVAATLGPAVLAALATVAPRVTHVTPGRAALVSLATAGATLLIATWSLLPRGHRVGGLALADAPLVTLYGVHGVGAALLTSALALALPHTGPGGWPIELYPLLAAFGVMEWQIRSLRHRCTVALRSCGDRASFAAAARRAYGRAAGLHLGAVAVAAAVVSGWLAWRGRPVPVLTPVAVLALGGCLFAALVLLARGRVAAVAAAWATAAVVYGLVRLLAAVTAGGALVRPSGTTRLVAAAAGGLPWRLAVGATGAAAPAPTLMAAAGAAVAALVVMSIFAGAICRPFEHG